VIERKIRLADTEAMKEFVDAAGKCDFDINVCYNSAVIDAKSFLGMLYLGFSKELTVKYGQQDAGFENIIRKYAVA
jgi:phosphotransferase system HPr-like phosphotransfer protein